MPGRYALAMFVVLIDVSLHVRLLFIFQNWIILNKKPVDSRDLNYIKLLQQYFYLLGQK